MGRMIMNKKALDLLHKLTKPEGKRKIRSPELLKSPDSNDPNWFFELPPGFNSALDITQTERKIDGKSQLVWTQGSAFSFQAGDTLYSHCNVYGCCWGMALKKMSYCLQILEAEEAVPEKRGVPRDPGKVAFRQYFIDKDSLTLQVGCSRVEVTQDYFVEYLITGIFPAHGSHW
jgi:hypothetical protein